MIELSQGYTTYYPLSVVTDRGNLASAVHVSPLTIERDIPLQVARMNLS